jgi:malate dehydrogenase (oxaloacetate-decarboxylating)
MIGIGAANIAIFRILVADGFKPENMLIVDSTSILNRTRTDIENKQNENPYKWDIARSTNPENISGGIAEALIGADVCISLSKSGPDTIKPDWLKKMAKNGIGFFCANPVPEIWPWDAKEAGLKVVATGRSDFPNQVNNSIGFPAIFRGTLDVRSTMITDEMCIAAAYELAQHAEDKGLTEEYIIPSMADWEVFIREAVAVGMKAIQQGVAREHMTQEALYSKSSKIIEDSRSTIDSLIKSGSISPPPKGV